MSADLSPADDPPFEDDPEEGVVPRWAMYDRFRPDTPEDAEAIVIPAMSRDAALARIRDVCSGVTLLERTAGRDLPIEGEEPRGPRLGDQRSILDELVRQINPSTGEWLAMAEVLPEATQEVWLDLGKGIDEIAMRWGREEDEHFRMAGGHAPASGRRPIPRDSLSFPKKTIRREELERVTLRRDLVVREIERKDDEASIDSILDSLPRRGLIRGIVRACFGDPTKSAVERADAEPTQEQRSTTDLAEQHQGDSSDVTRNRPVAEPPEEKNRRVRDFLDKKPRSTSEEVGRALNLKPQTVRRQPAWKERTRTSRLKTGKPGAKERPLNARTLAIRPGEDADPSDVAADRDELAVWRRLLRQSDTPTRGRVPQPEPRGSIRSDNRLLDGEPHR